MNNTAADITDLIAQVLSEYILVIRDAKSRCSSGSGVVGAVEAPPEATPA